MNESSRSQQKNQAEDKLQIRIQESVPGGPEPVDPIIAEGELKERRLRRLKLVLYELSLLGFGMFGLVVFGAFVAQCMAGLMSISRSGLLFLVLLFVVSVYLVVDGIRSLIGRTK